MKTGKYRVIYTVTLECDVLLDPEEDWQDALSNIDIPEGGSNNSVYCEGTFKIKDYVHESEV